MAFDGVQKPSRERRADKGTISSDEEKGNNGEIRKKRRNDFTVD